MGKLVYTDFRKPSFAKRNREKLKSLERELWLVSQDKKVYKGFSAFRKISTLLPLLWIFMPFAYLPFAGVVGGWAYSFVSERRFFISHLFHFGCKSCKNK
jgi:predicted DCC family thiol-disulfide oxidoreductase YuxK